MFLIIKETWFNVSKVDSFFTFDDVELKSNISKLSKIQLKFFYQKIIKIIFVYATFFSIYKYFFIL